MKRIIPTAVVASILFIGIFTVSSADPKQAKKKRALVQWEYKCIGVWDAKDAAAGMAKLFGGQVQPSQGLIGAAFAQQRATDNIISQKLNKLGKDGWELVSANDVRMILKRPRQAKQWYKSQ